MTPTRILNTNSARTVPPLMLARSRAVNGGAAGAFALPTPGGSSGPTGSLPGEPAASGPAKPETVAERAADKAKSKEGDDKKDTGEAEGEGAQGAEGTSGKAEGESGGAEGEGGDSQGGAAPGQPLTIHTLNGLLLTLPATASASVSGRVRTGGARGGGNAPAGDGKDAVGGQRETGAKGGAGASAAPMPGAAGGEQSAKSSAGHEAARQAALGAERPQVANGAAPDRNVQGRATREVERPERVGSPSAVQAESSAPAPSAARESKPPVMMGIGAITGRGAMVGDTTGAASRKSETARPNVPADRTGPAQVVRGVVAAVNQRGGKVTLDLEPNELGRMKVELKLDANTATATFHVNSPEARRLLEDALPQLRQALTDRGVSLERAEVIAPPGELFGAMASIQAGAQAVAMVVPGMPEELDVRGDRKRSSGGTEREESGSIGRDDGSSKDGDGGTDGGGDLRVMTIGPDGVDVTV